jgi:hypothetical protein
VGVDASVRLWDLGIVSKVRARGEGPMLRHFLAALCLLIAGCAQEPAQIVQETPSKIVGMNKQQVLVCMGSPAAKTAEGHTEVWSYSSDDDHSAVPLIAIASGTAVSVTRRCTVSIVMTDNLVSQVNYYGPSGALLTAGEQCAHVIQNCVR